MLLEIKKAVNDNIKEALGDVIIAGEIKEGFKRPSFFTYVTPISIRPAHRNYYDFNLIVGIRHYQGTDNRTDIDKLRKFEKLDNQFKLLLKVGKHNFLIKNKSYTPFTDDYGFELKFEISERMRVDLLTKEERKTMEELKYGLTRD